MESKLRTLSNNNSENISLRGLKLTALYYPERLCRFKEIDCSDNLLSNCSPFGAFQFCEALDLSSNKITSDGDIEKFVLPLPYLKTLRIKCNPLLNNEPITEHFTRKLECMKINS